MKKLSIIFRNTSILALVLFCSGFQQLVAQDSSAVKEVKTKPVLKPVKSTFESNWVLDNQTVMVAKKGTFEMDIQHRFGTVNNGYSDFFGLYAPSNIRIGFSYVIKNQLQLGAGFTKERIQWDATVKYAIIKQKVSGGSPVSVTFFGNTVIDTRAASNFVTFTDRISYFSELMIARKINTKFSVQVAPSISYFNNIPGYVDINGEIQPTMENAHIAIAAMGKYSLTPNMALVANYDQPLTQHVTNNPHPNISLGLEMTTSNHTFQVFAGNANSILPQNNNMYNQNDFTKGQFIIGFNITRLWNF
ncbi:MAG: DUF5777 family beta-barrel protein [Bacteroidetes bacterium]|nr:DUF5777 family beta-barrel protein [Bacteroidota bacterium]